MKHSGRSSWAAASRVDSLLAVLFTARVTAFRFRPTSLPHGHAATAAGLMLLLRASASTAAHRGYEPKNAPTVKKSNEDGNLVSLIKKLLPPKADTDTQYAHRAPRRSSSSPPDPTHHGDDVSRDVTNSSFMARMAPCCGLATFLGCPKPRTRALAPQTCTPPLVAQLVYDTAEGSQELAAHRRAAATPTARSPMNATRWPPPTSTRAPSSV